MNTSKRIMTIIGIIIMASFIVMLLLPQQQSSLEFEPIDGQFALLDKAHEAWFGQPTDPNDISAIPTICDWISYKARVAIEDTNDANEQAIRDAKGQLEADLAGLIANTSFSAIYWISEQAFQTLAPLYESKPEARQHIIDICQSHVPDIASIIDAEINAFDQIDRREHLRGNDALSRHNREKSPLSYTDTFGSPSSQNSIPLRVSIPPKNKQPSCGGKSNSPRYRFKIKSKKSNNSNTADCPTTFPSLKPFSIQKLGNSISLAKRLTTLSQAIPMI